ncbi:hypothetical protein [Rhodococcus qingshengii]|uniref:hypothetical protein n=1 Tax=Rhodococcus qingshengii TaxID=334542 RepID=UPI0018DA4DF5|nr:hypothetical protein [Rhodococcus qingshengii]QPG90952.1 hypothetical protein I1G86_06740 [Rhodococcus qingshengii]
MPRKDPAERADYRRTWHAVERVDARKWRALIAKGLIEPVVAELNRQHPGGTEQ